MTMHQRVLIYRLGSLGDTLVALPALRLIAQAFPEAERWMLTNYSINSKAASARQILDGTGLVYNYIEYPIGVRDFRTLAKLRAEIRKLRPSVLVYLAEPRGLFKTLRDVLFFRICGIRQMIGVPYSSRLQNCQPTQDGIYEYEGARLARCIRKLGRITFENYEQNELELSQAEYNTAQLSLIQLDRCHSLLAVSIGSKVDVNDWGDDNWSSLLARLSESFPGLCLIMLGAEIERERSDALIESWRGESLNLCGKLSVRESAAILERCRMFIGHDSGPMHLAAAVGARCVAIFSARNLPGVWFPRGIGHHVIYHSVECRGCGLELCEKYGKKCINEISVEEVYEEVVRLYRSEVN